MADSRDALKEIKALLQDTAFLVAQGDSAKTVHSNLLKSLELISSIEAKTKQEAQFDLSEKEVAEVRKVSNKLKLWAKRPNQINTKILSAYLKLHEEGHSKITEDMLKKALPRNTYFQSNFAQMKTISEKNHGKIFEQNGEQITLWKPIEREVFEFKRAIGGGCQERA